MNWYREAQKIYDREPSPRSFHEDLYSHYSHGYVVNTPDFFVMARIVPSCEPLEKLVNPGINWDIRYTDYNLDTWWIHCFAGREMLSIFTWAPVSLPLVGWEKRNKPRIYNLNSIKVRLENAHFQRGAHSNPVQ